MDHDEPGTTVTEGDSKHDQKPQKTNKSTEPLQRGVLSLYGPETVSM